MIVTFLIPAAFLIAAAVDALRGTFIMVVLVAASFAAILATFPAAADVPDRIGHNVESLHGCDRIVARDDQLASPRAFLRRLVPDQDAQAGARMQGRGEGVVDQLPVLARALEGDARDVQIAIAHIAYRDGALPEATGLHAADAGRSRDRELPGGHGAGNSDALRARRIVARDRERVHNSAPRPPSSSAKLGLTSRPKKATG